MDQEQPPPGFRRRPPLNSEAYKEWLRHGNDRPSGEAEPSPPPKAPIIGPGAGSGAGGAPPRPPGGRPLFGPAPSMPRPPSFAGGPVFVQHGSTGAMTGIAGMNLLLNMVTLTIWRFWATTRVRRFLWGNTTAWGDPVEYTGTGKELFIGFLLVALVVFLPLMLAFGAVQTMTVAFPPAGLLMIPLQLLVLFLVGAGLYRARRYQMSRTVWRGIRGGLEGSAVTYGITFVLVFMASVVTLGWAWPWGDMKLARYRLDNTSFGSHRFECDAVAAPLYKRFAVVWGSGIAFVVLMVLWLMAVMPSELDKSAPGATLGAIALGYVGAMVIGLFTVAVPLAWYKAAFYRQLAAHTRFGGLTFAAEVETWPLIRLMLGNWLLSLVTLGILRPVAALRTFRYACSVIAVDGRLDFGHLAQSNSERPQRGEGLIAVLDGAGDF